MKRISFYLVIIILISACGTNPQAALVSAPKPSATQTKIATNTPAPTPTQTPQPTSTITPIPTPTEVLVSRVFLSPMNTQWQSHNNCERASIAITLGYYDIWVDQHDLEHCVHNLPAEISKYGLYGRIFRVSSRNPVTMDYVVRWLLSQDIPVIVGGVVSTSDSTPHYRVVQGYDDNEQIFFINDSLLGQIEMVYDSFENLHRTSDNSVSGDIIPVYPLALDQMILEKMRSWSIYP